MRLELVSDIFAFIMIMSFMPEYNLPLFIHRKKNHQQQSTTINNIIKSTFSSWHAHQPPQALDTRALKAEQVRFKEQTEISVSSPFQSII